MNPDSEPPKPELPITDKLIEKRNKEQGDREENEKLNNELRQALKDELKDQKDRNDHHRSETFKDIFHSSIGFLLRVLHWGCVFILGVRIWHLIVPGCVRWLSKDELSDIDQLISYVIVGSFGSFVMKYMQKNVE